MAVDLDAISKSLRNFVRSHNAEFQKLTGRQSQLLEVGAFLTAAKHYEWIGYDVKLHNPRRGQIRVKLGTRGHPWNFSRFEIWGDGRRFEIHTNLPVRDAAETPGARYVVDVAVARSNRIPTSTPGHGQPGFEALANDHLITFVEAKSLVIYPMLIAQFIGIVHELKPAFLHERPADDFIEAGHFYPSLVSLGYLHGTCRNIVRGFPARQIHIGIVPEFDEAISRLASGPGDSPLQSARATGVEEVIVF
ncbi:MAG: hypothetical protein JST59_30600 [Actinobacteria bacterium]|nr:hypothetical protein [Actinomycetota bacterium]